MELILWRHAEAEEGSPDSARNLTEKGLKQARLMAAWFEPRLPKHIRIIVSPTERTRQTAEALSDDFETLREIGPGASANAILSAANWPEARGAVLVVGHQPTLGEVAGLLMSGEPLGWHIRKGAVWWFSHKGTSAQLVLRTVMSPEML
ncbi:MAG: phosphohistidine phosphatase SixA [Nitrosospira sp.]|nr:phosphohistidine phosphatase SixA [Nitrosospira sp.]